MVITGHHYYRRQVLETNTESNVGGRLTLEKLIALRDRLSGGISYDDIRSNEPAKLTQYANEIMRRTFKCQ